MASTYTQNTGIEKPGSGDQSGTWGVTANTNFDIIDKALNGQVTIPISGSQDLTTNDGSVSDGTSKVIVLTGAPGITFELRVTPVDQQKYYVIKNETDAACRVIYKGVTYSTSNGVEIAAGATQAVSGDGNGALGVFKSLTPNTDLVNDTSPQLGGPLDVNGESIVSVSNGDIDIAPNGTGAVNITGTTNITGDLDVDNLNINGNSISATNTNGGVFITPNGSGAITLTGAVDVTGNLDIDNINIDANSITSTNANGSINLTPNGTGSVVIDGLSHPQSDGTSGQVLSTNGSSVLSFSTINSYPQDIRIFTSGSSYALPGSAKAVLIKASGGGGGGAHWIFSGNNSGNGSPGGSTTVTNGTLGISITASGGAAGITGVGGYMDFLGGSGGGDILLGAGAAGGSMYMANYDTAAFAGGYANLVTKYVTGSSVGGQTISFSIGAGGAGSAYGRQGQGGFVEIWVW